MGYFKKKKIILLLGLFLTLGFGFQIFFNNYFIKSKVQAKEKFLKEIQIQGLGNMKINDDNYFEKNLLIGGGDDNFSFSTDYPNISALKFMGEDIDKINLKCAGNNILYKKNNNNWVNSKFSKRILKISTDPQQSVFFKLAISCKMSLEDSFQTPLKNIIFDESSILFNKDNLSSYSLSYNDMQIKEKEISENLFSPNLTSQPTFVDIIYLQLKTIGNLIKSLEALGISNYKTLFSNSKDYDNYLMWINDFSKFSTKKSFLNTMSGAVSLKDIGIGNDIIGGLSCALSNVLEKKGFDSDKCEKGIKISHGYLKKYDFYTRKEILEKIKSFVFPNFISFYNGLKSIKNKVDSENFGFASLGKNIKEFSKKVFDADARTEVNIGYGIKKRKQNLKNIMQNLDGDKANLLFLYNFYYELNKSVIGTRKISKIGKILKEENKNNRIELSHKLLYDESERDLKEQKETSIFGRVGKDYLLKLGKEGFKERMRFLGFNKNYKGYLLLSKGEILDDFLGITIPSKNIYVLKNQNKKWARNVLEENNLVSELSKGQNILSIKGFPKWKTIKIFGKKIPIDVKNVKIKNLNKLKRELFDNSDMLFLTDDPDLDLDLDIDVDVSLFDIDIDINIGVDLEYSY